MSAGADLDSRLTFDVALEGGGSRGIALNAALAELRARGHAIRRVVGTSAGSIAAALLAAGVTPDELVRMSRERTEDDLPVFSEWVREPLVPLTQFTETHPDEQDLLALSLPGELGRRLAAARAALAFLDRGGFVSGDGFVLWLCGALERVEPGLSRATLAELYARSGTHLTIVATDTTAQRLRALNHISAPRCPVVAAVRMSISIPLLFAEVVWRAEWGTYLGEPLEGHVIVDGGMLSNLPIGFIVPSASELVARLMGPPPERAAIPLAISLDHDEPVPDAPAARSQFLATRTMPELLGETRLGRRVNALAETMMRGIDRTLTDVDDAPGLLRLPVGGYAATEFDMSRARVEALLDAARRAARAYFDDLEARLRVRPAVRPVT